jgi:hypothetical protein
MNVINSSKQQRKNVKKKHLRKVEVKVEEYKRNHHHLLHHQNNNCQRFQVLSLSRLY